MRKAISHIIGLLLGALAILPAFSDDIKVFDIQGAVYSTWSLEIPVMVNSFLWVYCVIFIGLLCAFLWNCKIHVLIKLMASWIYISCFFSSAPYISFNAALLVIPAIYLFMLIKMESR